MIKLNNAESSQIKGGGCGKFTRNLRKAGRLLKRGRITDDVYDDLSRLFVAEHKACVQA